MSRKPDLEVKLARLASLKERLDRPETREEVRAFLDEGNGFVVAHAAALVGRARWKDFSPRLVAAFERFMSQPARDKGCTAKTAIVEALSEMEEEAPELYRIGSRHVQFEPVWGKRVDTAGELRGTCALALVRTGVPDAAFELVRLLADPLPAPRLAAARALSALGNETAELLLRLKALGGDEAPDVLAECFGGLLRLAPDRSLDFVAGFLRAGEPRVADLAAISIGESRTPAAFEILRNAWDESLDPGDREALLLPLALLRRDESFEFLLDVLARHRGRMREAILKALEIYSHEPDRQAAIDRALKRTASD